MNDTREQLERSIDRFLGSWTGWSVSIKVLREAIIGWLNRQAAITERECAEEQRARLSEMHDLLDEAASERELLRAELTEYKHSHPDAPNKPISQSDARKSAKTAETDAAKDDICDFGDASSMGDGVEQDNNRTCPISNGTRPNTCNKSVENVTDNRAQLEADLRKEIMEYAGEFHEGEEILYALITAMFDRQAAITEAEGFKKALSLLEGRDKTIAELQADLDKWNKLAESIELPDYPMIQFVPKDEWRKLEARIHEWLTPHVGVSVYTSEIEAEAKKWMNRAANIRGREIGFQMESWAKRVDDQSREIERLKAERENLAADLEECMELNDKLSDERERWRGTCGMMADAAHEIQRILDGLEGRDQDGKAVTQ